MSVKGSCLCGKVTLEVGSFDRDVVACHCAQCRKQSGHHFAATRAQNSELTIHGEEHLKWYRASGTAARGFCQHCGSTLFWRHDGTAHTSILAGCLEAPTGLKLDRHIFAADKGDYYELKDDVKIYPQAD
ncbi:aldehyde-activating protein [Chromatiales bacterium (ex Bugula neritina AB1)]|nr:aldehyde-activating protein [Chromatiales bacterium (ex Bugula neritina AB1)]